MSIPKYTFFAVFLKSQKGDQGSLLPVEISQMSLAVFIFTPGPMVEAATQLRIY